MPAAPQSITGAYDDMSKLMSREKQRERERERERPARTACATLLVSCPQTAKFAVPLAMTASIVTDIYEVSCVAAQTQHVTV